MKKGIIFHGSFEKSFMYHAISDGLAIPEKQSEDKEDKILSSILSDYNRAKKRKEVLELCLLYDKVFLYAYNDSFDLSRLVDENFIANITPIDPATYDRQINTQVHSSFLSKQDVSTCRFLKPVILPFLRTNDTRISSSKFDKMIELLSRDDFSNAVKKDRLSYSLLAEILPLTHITDETRNQLALQFLNDPSTKEKIKEITMREIVRTIFSILYLYDELITSMDLINQSAQMAIPLASSLIKNPSSSKAKPPIILPEMRDTYYNVFQVIVREVEYFPVLNTLNDVLKLRNDKRIVDFRENINRWAEALQNGEDKEEEKMRREIRKSNAALRSIEPWRKVSALVTYLSLPLSFVPFLSLPISALGVGVQLYTKSVEWKNRWLMVGR